MPAREGLKCLVLARAVCEVTTQQLLDGGGAVLGLDIAQDLSADRCFRTEAAADDDVKAFDGVALLVDGDLAADQPNVADIVLRARVGATREMDIDGLIDLKAGVDM